MTPVLFASQQIDVYRVLRPGILSRMLVPLLERVSESDRTKLLSVMSRRRYKKGETLFHEGDPGNVLHVIMKGKIAIRVSTSLGDVATLTILGPGEVFGEQALLTAEASRTATAVAMEPTETMTLHRADFDDLRSRHPQVESFLVQVLAAQVRRLSAQLLEALYVPADRRVIRRLASAAALFESPAGGSTVVTLTQSDLATMAGTTRPTVNQVLGQLAARGVLRLGRGRIEIIDPSSLHALAR
jgi:CRP-like cAMP-binding protein